MHAIELIHGHKPISAPAGVPVSDFDPYSDESLTDRGYFEELHAKRPFVFLPQYSMLACGGYDVTREVFSDHERFVSSRGVGLSDFGLEEPWRPASIILSASRRLASPARAMTLAIRSPLGVSVLIPLPLRACVAKRKRLAQMNVLRHTKA